MINKMKFKNWREFAFIFVIYATIQWIILTIVAMMFYAGGTYTNPNSPGYDFFSNFNSDLGRTVAYSGRPNTISYVIFTIANSVFAVSLIPFFIAIYQFFKERGKEKWMALVGSIFGIFAGIGFLATVFTPWDLYFDLHIMFNSISFLAVLLLVIFYSFAIYLNEDYPNIYTYVQVIYTILVAIYLVVLFTGPSINTAEGLRVQATWQKVLLFAGIINILIQGYGAWKFEQSF